MFIVAEINYIEGVDAFDPEEAKLFHSEENAKKYAEALKDQYIEESNDYTFMENQSSDTCYVFADRLWDDGESRDGEFRIIVSEIAVQDA